MLALSLTVFVVLTWAVGAVASSYRYKLDHERRSTPLKHRHGASVFPEVVLGPALFLLIGGGLNLWAEPWGFYLVGLLHVLLLVAFAVLILRDRQLLREAREAAERGPQAGPL